MKAMARKGRARRRALLVSCALGVMSLGVALAAAGAPDAGPTRSALAWGASEPGYPRVALPPLEGVAPVAPGPSAGMDYPRVVLAPLGGAGSLSAGSDYPRVALPPLGGAAPAAVADEEEDGDLVTSSAVPGGVVTVMGVTSRFTAAEERCTPGDVLCIVRVATSRDLESISRSLRDVQERVSRLERRR